MIFVRTKAIFVFCIMFTYGKTLCGQTVPSIRQQRLRFIDDIEIIKGEIKTSGTTNNDGMVEVEKKNLYSPTFTTASQANIESANRFQIKYALLMDTEVEKLNNSNLYAFIEKWMGTPYRYGAQSESGTDCSGFSGILHRSVYKIDLPRTARAQYQSCQKVKNDELKEGDLVFFNTRGGVSHVGVYLHNGYFIHASTKEGVRINNLKDEYYNGRFIGAGRPSSE